MRRQDKLIRDLQARNRAYKEQLALLAALLESASASKSMTAQSIPQFPWPPPQASGVALIPGDLLTVNDRSQPTTLRDVDSRLSNALEQCGYYEKRYYATPDGFALVTRLEHIDSDGCPKEPRWSTEIGAFGRFSLSRYLKALFTAPYGHYRVIALVITSRSFATTGTPVPAEDTKQWLVAGLNALPPTVGARAFTPSHRLTVLIYEFEKCGYEGNIDFLVPGKLQGLTHLECSGVLAALGGNSCRFP